MKKSAFFVEGMTEQEFVVALIASLSGTKGVHVSLGYQYRGMVTVRGASPKPTDDFFILVVDCSSDAQVKSQICDQYNSLVASGYTSIVGLRDVYPLTYADVSPLAQQLAVGLPSGPVAPEMHLAVMEIEAWFLAEWSHFARVSPRLQLTTIASAGFDVAVEHPEVWPQPASTLDSIYKIGGARYMDRHGRKTRKRVQRTLRALDIVSLCTWIRLRVPRMSRFFSSVEEALT